MNSNNTSNHITDISLSNSATIAGIGLIFMAILAPIANYSIIQGLIVSEDAAKTVNNIIASEGLYRLAICFLLMNAVLDIIVAWALYVFLKPVNQSLSMLTAWFRIVYATMFAKGFEPILVQVFFSLAVDLQNFNSVQLYIHNHL